MFLLFHKVVMEVETTSVSLKIEDWCRSWYRCALWVRPGPKCLTEQTLWLHVGDDFICYVIVTNSDFGGFTFTQQFGSDSN